MTITFLCLANSRNPHQSNDHLIAGIEVTAKDGNYQFVLNEHKHPRWLKLKSTDVSTTNEVYEKLKVFDILEVESTAPQASAMQPEVISVKPGSERIIKNHPLTTQVFKKLIDHRPRSLFGNKGSSVNGLTSPQPHPFTIIKAQYPIFYSPSPKRSKKLRLKFYYNNHLYDLAVTDKNIIEKYFYYQPIHLDPEYTYLTISLEKMSINNRRYKVISGILQATPVHSDNEQTSLRA